MKTKNLIILFVVLTVLTGVALIKKGMREEVPTIEEGLDIVASPVNLEDITGAVFRFGETKPEARLLKQEGKWVVESQYGVAADEEALKRFFEKIDGLKGELRSDNEALFGDYGIAGQEGVHIILEAGGLAPVHLVVGAKRAGFNGSFIRHKDQAAVYVVEENILSDFGLWGEVKEENFKTDQWFDKRIVHIEADDVAAIAISEESKDEKTVWLDLKQEDTDGKKKWVSAVEYPFGLSATKIKNWFRSFDNIRAREVVDSNAEGVWDGDLWEAALTFKDGRQLTLVRGGKDEKARDYYVKASDDYAFLVPVSVFDGFLRGTGDVFVTNPLGVDEGNISKVEVQDLKEKKKFSAQRAVKELSDAGEVAEGEKPEAVWKTPKGDDIEKTKVEDIIRKFKGLDIHAGPPGGKALKKALVITFSEEGQTHTYTVTEDEKTSRGKDCQYLRIAGDANGYCYLKSSVDNFQKAVPFSD